MSHTTVSTAIEYMEKFVEVTKADIIVSDECANTFCRRLRGLLGTIILDLKESQLGTEDPDLLALPKIEGLLSNIERLCGTSPIRTGTAKQWPTLSGLPTRKAAAVSYLRRFAKSETSADAERRSQILIKLKKLERGKFKNEAKKVQLSQMPTISKERRTDHLDEEIEYLREALSQYIACMKNGLRSEITVKVRLSDCQHIISDDVSGGDFGVLFLDHPHSKAGYWQEARIRTCRPKIAGRRAPHFDIEETKIPAAPSPPVEHLDPKTFCKHISYRIDDSVHFSTVDDGLLYQKRSDMSREWLQHMGAVRLTDALNDSEKALTDRSKAILGSLIAKATWQLYNSHAIGQGLTSDDIYFLYERRQSGDGIFVNEPMLLLRFDNKIARAEAHRDDSRKMIHDKPKLLALGIVLLELETRQSIHRHIQGTHFRQQGSVNINTPYKVANYIIGEEYAGNPLNDMISFSPLQKILPLCIKAKQFENHMQEAFHAAKQINQASQVGYDGNAVRQLIHDEIVKPLQDWANLHSTVANLTPLLKANDDHLGFRGPSCTLPQVRSGISSNRRAKSDDESNLHQASQKWFEDYDKLKEVLQPTPVEVSTHKYPSVKVAILDTGISADDFDHFQAHRLDIIFHDLVENSEQPCDESGHGSKAASLIFRMCPLAEVKIVRVLRNNIVSHADVTTVVQGIDWAIREQIDILSLALGFDAEYPDLVAAVGRAHACGILIFSAASNDGNTKAIYCPAIISDKVFGMYSTDAHIRESRSFNPSPPDDGEGFALFGENVEMFVKNRYQLVSGTSYSTSIASGLAAALLGFSRQAHKGGPIDALKGREQMKKLFVKMAIREGKYYLIRPWSLLKRDVNNTSGREKQREWIHGTIDRLLSYAS